MNNVQPPAAVIAPIAKAVIVGLPIEKAFRVFTEETSRWWPLVSHSVYGREVARCRLDGRVGGRSYEITCDGAAG
jgi:hypothetical protein